MNEKEFNGLILAELVKIANEVFTNEIEIAKRNKKAVSHFVLLPERTKFIYLIMTQTVTDTKNFV